MLRRGLILTFALLAHPASAYEIKPKTPDTGFTGKLHPDILGISPDSTADSARAVFDQWFKGRTDTKTDIQQPRFGSTATSFTAKLTYTVAPSATQTGEVLVGSFSSPASGNRAYFIARNLVFAEGQQPAKADMVKEVMGKYGSPTIVGDQHLYYIYRGGSIVSVGAKYKDAAAAIEAIDKPLEPRVAVKLNADNGRGSCVAVIKRAQAKEKSSLAALLDEARGANCDGVLSVQLIPSPVVDRVGVAQFTLLDVKRTISAAAIDAEALAAEAGERNAMPKGSAPKL